MDGSALEMRGITKTFPGVVALDHVDFDLRKGEIHALVGENGAGKSTLIKILTGIYTRDGGEIWIDGERVVIATTQHALAHGISVIPQELNLVPYFDAMSNLWAGREDAIGGLFVDRARMRSETSAVFERMGVKVPIQVAVKRLSVAQQQMVAIGRALSQLAKVLVMDEPTARLGAHDIQRLFELMEQLRKQGTTIIYISHRLDEVFRLADRITVLKDGQVQGTLDTRSTTPEQVIQLMVGKELHDRYHKEVVSIGAPLLVAREISDGAKLGNLSFEVRAGEILGVVGAVGSGRTELVRLLFGAGRLAHGTLVLGGNRFVPTGPADAIAQGMGLVPEDRRGQGLVLHMEIAENVTLPNLKRWSTLRLLRPRREREAATGLARQVDLRMTGIRQRVRYLSGGNQQKVVLAKWLGMASRVFLLDEPTAGIDVGAKVEIYRLVGRLVAGGAAVVFVSSEIPEVLGLADRVLVMRGGAVAAMFDRSEATEEKLLTAMLSGGSAPQQPAPEAA